MYIYNQEYFNNTLKIDILKTNSLDLSLNRYLTS